MSKDKNQISNFNGYFEFLNNDFPTWVMFDGQLYPSVTTAFQAARCEDIQVRKQIQQAEDYDLLRQIVMKVKNPEGWSHQRYKIMESLVRDKFKRNRDIKEKLKQTQDRPLVNTYQEPGENQSYWGVYKDKGTNCLGKILVCIRDEIRKGIDLQRWLNDYALQKNPDLWPKVTLKCLKQGQPAGELLLTNRALHTLGSLDTNDYKLQHPSISKQHAVIFYNSDIKTVLVDLESTAGTTLNGFKLQPLIHYQLNENDEIVFGLSSRKYQVVINTAAAEDYFHRRSQQIKNEMREIQELDGQISNAEIRSKLGFKVQDCILVDGIPLTTSYRALKDFFEEWVKVKSINMLLDNKTGKSVGIALIYVQSQKEAQQLVRRRKPLKMSGNPLLLKLMDSFEASKILSAYKIETPEQTKRERERSRSRSGDKSRDRNRDRSGDRSRTKDRRQRH